MSILPAYIAHEISHVPENASKFVKMVNMITSKFLDFEDKLINFYNHIFGGLAQKEWETDKKGMELLLKAGYNPDILEEFLVYQLKEVNPKSVLLAYLMNNCLMFRYYKLREQKLKKF